jgi:hypothetical protein
MTTDASVRIDGWAGELVGDRIWASALGKLNLNIELTD